MTVVFPRSFSALISARRFSGPACASTHLLSFYGKILGSPRLRFLPASTSPKSCFCFEFGLVGNFKARNVVEIANYERSPKGMTWTGDEQDRVGRRQGKVGMRHRESLPVVHADTHRPMGGVVNQFTQLTLFHGPTLPRQPQCGNANSFASGSTHFWCSLMRSTRRSTASASGMLNLTGFLPT